MYQMESVNKDKPPALLPSEQNRPKGRQYPTSAFNQFFTLTRRTTLGTIRNFSLSVLRFIGLIIFSLFMGLIYRNIGKDASNIISNTAFINLSLANIVFVNSVAVILSCKSTSTHASIEATTDHPLSLHSPNRSVGLPARVPSQLLLGRGLLLLQTFRRLCAHDGGQLLLLRDWLLPNWSTGGTGALPRLRARAPADGVVRTDLRNLQWVCVFD